VREGRRLILEDQRLAVKGHQPEQRSAKSRVLIRNLVFIVVGTTLFTLAYAQAPLYTSNQNQYFLHGFAKAGFGYLNEDWLANTLDPTPVFSKLIEFSWRVLPWEPVFYLYFAILAGILLFSLLGIAHLIWGIKNSRPQKWLYLTILIGLFSAGLRYLSARFIGLAWEFTFDGGVAGQRLLGTVFQPSTFGVFLILSIYLFLRKKGGWAVVCLLVATSFHPTYLLSAAILTTLYMGITFWETKKLRIPLALGLGALIGVSPILWNTLTTFGGSDKLVSAQARNILVTFRIPHHAVVAEWLDVAVLFKLIFVGLALVVLYSAQKQEPATPANTLRVSTKLFHIILWPAVMAIALTIVQVLTQNVVLALLFPWRLSTWLVPLSVSLISGWLVCWSFERYQLGRYSGWIMALSGVAILIFSGVGISKSVISYQQKQALNEQGVMRYVEANKQPGETYLIPLKMQDFRLETGAPVYIEFKSIPYKDVDVLEWRRRVNLARKFYERTRCKKLIELAETEGFTHVILPVGHETTECKQTEFVFQDEFYGVYKIIAPE